MLAQVLAGAGVNGINLSNLGSLFGKRDLSEAEMRGFVDAMTQALTDVYTNVIQKPLEGALSSKSSEKRVSRLLLSCHFTRWCSNVGSSACWCWCQWY